MISLRQARELRDAGLKWTPADYDFFAIPDRGLDDRIFVISDMMVNLALVGGQLAATFQGSVEWALDFLVVAELVWLPSEGQLRDQLEHRLIGEPRPVLTLSTTDEGYRCAIHFRGAPLEFEATDPVEAYAAALKHVLAPSKG